MTELADRACIIAKVRAAAVFTAGLDAAISRARASSLSDEQQHRELSRALYNFGRVADLMQQIVELRPDLLNRSGWLGELIALPFKKGDG